MISHIEAQTKWPTFRRRRFKGIFSWMKIYEFRIISHWSFFLQVKLITFHHWFRQWLGADQATKPLFEPVVVSLLTHLCVTRPQWVKEHVTCGDMFYLARCRLIESIKTTSMEIVSSGVFEKIKNNIKEVKIKPKNDMMYQDIYNSIGRNRKKSVKIQKKWRYTIHYVKHTAQLLKVDFQKVDQYAGSKWLIHDTKRRKDKQLQSLKLPCRISKLSR